MCAMPYHDARPIVHPNMKRGGATKALRPVTPRPMSGVPRPPAGRSAPASATGNSISRSMSTDARPGPRRARTADADVPNSWTPTTQEEILDFLAYGVHAPYAHVAAAMLILNCAIPACTPSTAASRPSRLRRRNGR